MQSTEEHNCNNCCNMGNRAVCDFFWIDDNEICDSYEERTLMNSKNLKIEYVNIEAIKPYERNAKTHPIEQIQQIMESIKQFGMNDPIAIWNDEIVEGHGRLIACMNLGMKTVPIIRLDDLTDEQRRAYTLVHNKLTMNSDFDATLLMQELSDITSIDMEDFGFNPDDINLDDDFDDDMEDFESRDFEKVIQCPHCKNKFKLNNRFEII